MTAVSLIVTLLLIAAFFVLFGIGPAAFARLTAPFRRAEDQRRRIERITGKEPRGLRRRVVQAEQMLLSAGMGEDWGKYKLAAGILALIGVAAGLALDNIFAALVLVPVLAMTPLMVVHARTMQYVRQAASGAQSAMTVVTNAYMLSEDLISAVRIALPNLQQPMRGVFEAFIRDVEMIDPNVTAALRSLKTKVNNRYWQAWCDVLMECQDDRGLREVLRTILRRFSAMQRLQMELDTQVKSFFIYFALELLLVIFVPVLIGLMIPDFSQLLFGTQPGKIALAVALLAIFFSTLRMIKVNRPLDV